MTPQSVPPLSKFSGEEPNPGEFFQEWKEHFELTADLLGWNDRAKLVNLITRLRGQAHAFYRSCTVAQRGSYSMLMSALGTRFTPVVIPAVQTSLFHDRKQDVRETVDSYAQDLRRLFLKAYPSVQQGSKEAEELGKSVLASQFIAGLRMELKKKIAGQEGDIDSLIVKARFEEAKEKSFGREQVQGTSKPATNHKSPSTTPTVTNTTSPRQNDNRHGGPHRSGISQVKCHACGGLGHFARACPLKSKGGTAEATGHKVAAVVPEQPTQRTRKQWQDEAIDKELEKVCVTLHGVNIARQEVGEVTLGVTPVTELEIEGAPVRALVDTGSPVSIVSSKFLFQALGKKKNSEQTPDEWAVEVKQRLNPPPVRLKSYSGNTLPILKQIQVQVRRKAKQITAWVQVQQDAPVDFLLGMDLQNRLGFHLYEDNDPVSPDSTPENTIRDAVTETKTIPTANVCLLEAVRIPAKFERLVPVKKVGQSPGPVSLFTPKPDLDTIGTLTMEDGLLWTGERGMISICNTGPQPVRLEEGEVLGSIEAVDIVDVGEESEVVCCGVQVRGDANEGRRSNLLQSLPTDNWDLDDQERVRLRGLVLQYEDIFALDDSELGRAEGVSHVINTEGEKPIKRYPRRVPFSLRGKVEEMIKKMEEQGVIQPSHSLWASPIVLVAKKDGSTRFCVDYRKLNAIMKMDVYPLPRIDDMLDLLANNQYFSTLDLASGYWQVKMDQSLQEKQLSLHKWAYTSFGLCHSAYAMHRPLFNV